MNPDRRRYPRISVEVKVALRYPGEPVRVARTRYPTGGGVPLVIAGDHQPGDCHPALGAAVALRVVGPG
jgi:hypothetical protein